MLAGFGFALALLRLWGGHAPARMLKDEICGTEPTCPGLPAKVNLESAISQLVFRQRNEPNQQEYKLNHGFSSGAKEMPIILSHWVWDDLLYSILMATKNSQRYSPFSPYFSNIRYVYLRKMPAWDSCIHSSFSISLLLYLSQLLSCVYLFISSQLKSFSFHPGLSKVSLQ